MNLAGKIQKELQSRCNYLWGQAKASKTSVEKNYWETLAYEADIAFASAQKLINLAHKEVES
jgi:hypothetical protein